MFFKIQKLLPLFVVFTLICINAIPVLAQQKRPWVRILKDNILGGSVYINYTSINRKNGYSLYETMAETTKPVNNVYSTISREVMNCRDKKRIIMRLENYNKDGKLVGIDGTRREVTLQTTDTSEYLIASAVHMMACTN